MRPLRTHRVVALRALRKALIQEPVLHPRRDNHRGAARNGEALDVPWTARGQGVDTAHPVVVFPLVR